jgi:hypothetical protein
LIERLNSGLGRALTRSSALGSLGKITFLGEWADDLRPAMDDARLDVAKEG